MLETLAKFWDWIETRRIDQHAVAIAVLWITWEITKWGMNTYNQFPDREGSDLAFVLGAIMIPWTPCVGVVMKYWFDNTKNSSS